MAILADLERKISLSRHLLRKIIKYKTDVQIIFLDYPLFTESVVALIILSVDYCFDVVNGTN